MCGKDEFYERFPHVFDLPQHPQCKECFGVFDFNLRDEDDHCVLEMIESHNEGCPHYERDGQTYRICEKPACCRPSKK